MLLYGLAAVIYGSYTALDRLRADDIESRSLAIAAGALMVVGGIVMASCGLLAMRQRRTRMSDATESA